MRSAKKRHVYVNRHTGDVQILTKSQGKHLNEDWSKTEQITNDQGEKGMRIQLHGATVDILETKSVEVKPDGDRDSK